MTRRKTARAKGRPGANRVIPALLVVLALGGVYALAGFGRPAALTAAAAAGSPGQLAVTSAIVGCPAPGSGGSTGGSVAEANSKAGQGIASWTSANQAGPASPRGTANGLAKPGQLSVVGWRKAPVIPAKRANLPSMAGGAVPTSLASGGLIIKASGAAAQGLDVEQLGPDGRPTARCQGPGADFWFVGPSAPKLHIELYLLNVDNAPADAAVSVQTDSGPRIGPADSGILIPPHGMVLQSLDKVVGPAKAIALHVTTSTGRVVAAVRETSSLAKPGGWLPDAAPPATAQVLTGLPRSPGTRTLYLTVPGSVPAQVRVTAVTRHGTYVPTGGSSINLPSQLTQAVQLPSLAGIPGSVKITANVPVAAVMVTSGGQAGSLGAYITGSDAITEQGVVAASPVGKLGRTELVLCAPGRAASVRISLAGPGAPLTGSIGQIVQVPAKSATEVPITLPKGARSAKTRLVALIVTPLPGSGPVYGARLALSGGSVQTILPISSSPTAVILPMVTESLLKVLGGGS